MYGFKAFIFDGKKTAGKALDTLEDYTPAYAWIDDAAVVSKSKHGSIRVHSTWAQDDSDVCAGSGLGALTGAVVGMLFGPAGAIAGAMTGGSLGMLFGASADMAFDDPRLDDFADSLVYDSSSLILVGDDDALTEFTAAVEPFGGGKVIQTDLNEDDIKALRKAMKKEASVA